MKLKNIVLAVSLAAGLLGCQSAFEFTNEQKNAPLRPDVKERMQALRGNTYVREIRTEDVAKSRPVFKSGQGLILREVLAETLPGYAIIPKGQADLNQPVDVMASGMSVADFIEYVEGTLISTSRSSAIASSSAASKPASGTLPPLPRPGT